MKNYKKEISPYFFSSKLTHLSFTCSKAALETLEKGVKYVKS